MKLTTWLKKLGNRDVAAITLVIGKTEYKGAVYTHVGHYTADMMAVTHDNKQAGDIYLDKRYILLGDVPPSYKKKAVYVIDGQECYLSSYYDKAQKNKYHPHGNCFQLAEWKGATAIDYGEKKKRERMEVKLYLED